MKKDRDTLLSVDTFIEDFKARGDIRIDDNLLNYNVQNGILSLRFVERKNINKTIVEKLDNNWFSFDEYRDTEYGPAKDGDLSQGFSAFLTYGYLDGYEICFYIKYLVRNVVKGSSITGIEIYSSCLMDHFYKALDFDYNTNGFIEDLPCAEIDISGIHFVIKKTVAVSYRRDKDSLKIKFPKQYFGGFVFYADKNIPIDIVCKIVSGINSYCNFLLCDAGNYICNVELKNDDKHFRDNIFYAKRGKALASEVRFKYDDIASIFGNIMKMFLVENYDLKNLYLLETNVCGTLDILRVASMFENVYRKSCQHGLQDYVTRENDYKEAYCNVIKIGAPQNDIEKSIVQGEEKHRNTLCTSLRSRLKFVFDKLLSCLNIRKANISKSFGVLLTGYDMTDLANRISEARNDIAHYLENNIDYNTTLRDVSVLQIMIYFMTFEQLGLSVEQIQKIVLWDSMQMRHYFGLK